MAKEDLNKYIKKSHVTALEPDHLDAIQNGEAEFHNNEEED